MFLPQSMTSRAFLKIVFYPAIKKGPAAFRANRFYGTTNESTSTGSAGRDQNCSGTSSSSSRKTSSFAADTTFAEANRKATGAGIPKLAGLSNKKQTYYYANRNAFTRLRHWNLRYVFVVRSAVRRYKFWIILTVAILAHFAYYHAKYRTVYGPDYPITNFDWHMRKQAGTLDPELIRRSEQHDRYIRLRLREEIKEE